MFVHKDWSAEQGGAFRIETEEGTHTFNSDPNLWLVGNRSHPHWMEPIKSAPTLRTIFGVSWFQGSTRIQDPPGSSYKHKSLVVNETNWTDRTREVDANEK